MTHEEAVELLPSYALGALDDVSELEQHLETCPECQAALVSLLEATAELGEAVVRVSPPESLRERVLSAAEAAGSRRARTPSREGVARGLVPLPLRLRRWRARDIAQSEGDGHERPRHPLRLAGLGPLGRRLSGPLSVAALAAVLLIAVLGTGVVAQQRQLGRQQQQLALDERGLALLTSTETSVERLNPVGSLPAAAHGHWYHRAGVPTQVVVVEFLPPPPNGQAYFGWLRHADGRWQATGSFTLDATGYGRLVLLGGDGSDVREVLVTRQTGPTAGPTGVSVLEWTR